jgi:putative transcriptional regulator
MKNNIKVQRAMHGLTQAELAERSKVSRQTINAMELGKYVPSTVLALRLSKIFGIPVNELFELGPED